MSCPRLPVLVIAACVAAGCLPAGAQEWRAGEGAGGARAFFTLGGRPAGLEFACEGRGTIRTIVAGNGAQFPGGRDLTLALVVDGTAHVTSVRAEAEPNGAGSRFVRRDAAAALAPLIAALAKGKTLEVAGPTGLVALPLKGSGKAMARLASGCGG
jgi:hypothetical protein